MLNKARVAYAKSKRLESVDHDLTVLEKQIKQIEVLILSRAKRHFKETRINAVGVHEDVAEHFRKEGFIVWENDLVLVIKIP